MTTRSHRELQARLEDAIRKMREVEENLRAGIPPSIVEAIELTMYAEGIDRVDAQRTAGEFLTRRNAGLDGLSDAIVDLQRATDTLARVKNLIDRFRETGGDIIYTGGE